ncbi:uncharacterized protein LOC143028217 [Oratosquilla oratoria]|uniref:uncharacterized protein LOC143028217 n=1 Tax=Oratosquilla oratoria TaxID=337810 RepID=UPI003F76EB39
MNAYLILALLILPSAVMAAEDHLQLQIYVVTGVLSCVCGLLTIATLYLIVSVSGLKSKVFLLQKAGGAAAAAIIQTTDKNKGRNPRPGYKNNAYEEPEERTHMRSGDYVDDYRGRPVSGRMNGQREDYGRREEYPMPSRGNVYGGVPGVRALGDRYGDDSPPPHRAGPSAPSRYADRRY